MKLDEVRFKTDELRRKAEKELDYDDDGEVTSKDFFATKGGRRALAIGAVVVFILLAIAFGGPAKAADEEGMTLPVDCGQAVCVIPKAVFQQLVEAHNANIDELRRLKAQLEDKPVLKCPGMRST